MLKLAGALEQSKLKGIKVDPERKGCFLFNERLIEILYKAGIYLDSGLSNDQDLVTFTFVSRDKKETFTAPVFERNKKQGGFDIFVDLSRVLIPAKNWSNLIEYNPINSFVLKTHPRDTLLIELHWEKRVDEWLFIHFGRDGVERLRILGLNQDHLIEEEIQVPDDSEMDSIDITDIQFWVNDAREGLIYINFS